MTRKTLRTAGTLLLLLVICTGQTPHLLFGATVPETKTSTGLDIVERRYCTQFGPFLIRLDGDKAAGIYAIVPNGHLGTMIGSVAVDRIVGRWHEAATAGDIEVRGRGKWSGFVAKYRTDSDPEHWHEGWLGQEEPPDRPQSFEHEGVRYLCERPPGAP